MQARRQEFSSPELMCGLAKHIDLPVIPALGRRRQRLPGQAGWMNWVELVSSGFSERLCLNKYSGEWSRKAPAINFWALHICAHALAHTCAHIHAHPHSDIAVMHIENARGI